MAQYVACRNPQSCGVTRHVKGSSSEKECINNARKSKHGGAASLDAKSKSMFNAAPTATKRQSSVAEAEKPQIGTINLDALPKSFDGREEEVKREFEIETEVGDMKFYAHPDSIRLSCDKEKPLMINGVPHTYSANISRNKETGNVEVGGYSLYRSDKNFGLGEPSDAARRKMYEFNTMMGEDLLQDSEEPDMFDDARHQAEYEAKQNVIKEKRKKIADLRAQLEEAEAELQSSEDSLSSFIDEYQGE